ncbi:molybdopterin synthase sulfur carrier subunit [Salinigranum rubrum]|uniref:Molybdopterin synthase sulfur carrier subunit n=1 Tax=Salinigranum rubrum TaxID=755307 RepID=A0A2I8VKW8_9EURY|nr:ubiquitin-like small modifier protein 1 [Salinigranum rubrum]AUV82558.1 molybdopterin synthase sulfur carrier subunit [Salinigranum rubrum]
MELTVYGPLRSATGEKTVQVDSEGETVRDVLEAFVDAYPRAGAHLTDDEGALRPSVRVLVGERKVDLDESVADADSMQLFPAMRGG